MKPQSIDETAGRESVEAGCEKIAVFYREKTASRRENLQDAVFCTYNFTVFTVIPAQKFYGRLILYST